MTANAEPEAIARLPKRAQQRMEHLEKEADFWKAKAHVGPKDSNTFSKMVEVYTPLGKSPDIVFQYGPGWRDRIVVCLRGEEIEVSGGDQLQVLPQVANVVKIRATRTL